MGEAAHERISRLFTIPAMVEGTLSTYARVLEARANHRKPDTGAYGAKG
jgi:hypothetical protein